MDKATLTMIENLHKNTGKSLEKWTDIVKMENFAKHGEVIKFLKDKHGLSHGFVKHSLLPDHRFSNIGFSS